MPRIEICDVGIEVDGQRLKEYGTQYIGKTAITWIESEAGKRFSIGLKADRIFMMDLLVEIFLDGKHIGGYIYLRTSNSFKCSCVPGSNVTQKPFLFTTLTVTDEENLASPRANLEELGSVKIVVRRGNASPSPSFYNHIPGPLGGSLIHERAKKEQKVGSHCIALGNEERCFPWRWMRFFPSPAFPHPIAEFTFLYRPRPFLQAQGIVPRDVAHPFPFLVFPQAGPSRLANEGLNHFKAVLTEEKAREEALRAIRKEQKALKRRLADLKAHAHPLKRVKKEVKPDLKLATSKINGGVIDLTAD